MNRSIVALNIRETMTLYDLTLLFLGVLLICLFFARFDLSRPKILLLLAVSLALFLVIFFMFHHHYRQTCTILAGDSLEDIKGLILSWGVAAPLMSIFLMTMQSVIAPLPAFLVTAANGIVFGLYWGTLISWTGAMCGAIVSFMMSRFFYKSFSEKIRRHKQGIEYIERLETRYGFRVVLTARLLPFISFDIISYAAGLSTIKLRSFLTATGIGMLPATILYTVFGSEIEKLKAYSDGLFTFSIVAVLVLILVWTIQGIYKRKKGASITSNHGGPES
jgi:uncharacterized membrane protein YdjX (TVP38/TMEM64 family)